MKVTKSMMEMIHLGPIWVVGRMGPKNDKINYGKIYSGRPDKIFISLIMQSYQMLIVFALSTGVPTMEVVRERNCPSVVQIDRPYYKLMVRSTNKCIARNAN